MSHTGGAKQGLVSALTLFTNGVVAGGWWDNTVCLRTGGPCDTDACAVRSAPYKRSSKGGHLPWRLAAGETRHRNDMPSGAPPSKGAEADQVVEVDG